MDTPPFSIVQRELPVNALASIASLFDVTAYGSAGEADSETIDLLSPLAQDEIPQNYHSWVEKRQREYRLGRHHARLALIEAGVKSPTVRRGDDGLPLFPEGLHGTLTHTGRLVTYAAAAVCSAQHSLGLDAENHKQLSNDMVDAILLPHEQRRFHLSTSDENGSPKEIGLFALWVFSMKEAFYKCVYPRCAAPFGFLDLDVQVDPKNLRFFVELLDKKYPDVPRTLSGRYHLDHKRIICGVTWPGAGSAFKDSGI